MAFKTPTPLFPNISNTFATPHLATSAKPAAAAPSFESKFDRWFDLNEFDFSMRYRGVDDSNGAHEFSQGQQRGIIDGKFKFDEQGKYGLVLHASTGKSFNWAYANFIGGGNQEGLTKEYAKATKDQQTLLYYDDLVFDPTQVKESWNSGGWAFYVRRLYLDIQPVKGLGAEYGSLDFNRGAASEITTYDNDGYVDGARILIERPKQLFLDEISVTYAYMGDLYTPNMFDRTDRFKQSNYHQFLLRKQIGKRVNTSFDYTWQSKNNTLTEAIFVHIPETKVLDSVRFEAYQRLNNVHYPELPTSNISATGNGYAVTLSKKLTSRFDVDGGYASIDTWQTILTQELLSSTIGLSVNGDSFGIGNRVFVRPTVKLTPYLEATGYYTHESGAAASPYALIWNRQAIQAGLNFDMKKAIFHKSPVQ